MAKDQMYVIERGAQTFVEYIKKFVSHGYRVSNYDTNDLWFTINIGEDDTFNPDYYVNKYIGKYWKIDVINYPRSDNKYALIKINRDCASEPSDAIPIELLAANALYVFVCRYLIDYVPY